MYFASSAPENGGSIANIHEIKVTTMCFASSATESGGSRANIHEDIGFMIGLIMGTLIWFLSMAAILRRYVVHVTLRKGNAPSHLGVVTGAGGDTQGNNDTGLPPQATEQADTLPEIVTGEPIAAPYADITWFEQRGRPPRDGTNSLSLEIEPEDVALHYEHVLVLIKQGRHRTKFFPTGLGGKWTDRDTFSYIKDYYDCFKRSWWYLNTLSHVEFKKVGASKFVS